MKRKVNLVGNKTLTVSLPLKWCKLYGIEKGEELDLQEDGSQIIISKDKSTKIIDEVEINLGGSSDFYKRIIENPYFEGVNKLKINFQDNKIPLLIEEELDRLLGFVITTQNKNNLIVEYIGEKSPEYSNIIRKVFLILKNHLDSFNDSKDLTDYFEQFIKLEKGTSKSIFFSIRVLNTCGHYKKNKTIFVYSMMWLLEQILDDYKSIADNYLNKKINFGSKEKELYNVISEYYNLFLEQLYNYNKKNYSHFYEFKDKIKRKILEINPTEKNYLLISGLNSIFNKIYHLGIFICESNHSFMTK